MADEVQLPEARRAALLRGALARALVVAIFVAALLVYATTIKLVVTLLFSAVVIAVALNGPVTWLERRRVPRSVGTLGIVLASVAVFVGVAFVVGATFAEQVDELVEDVPGYVDDLKNRSDELLRRYPALDAAYEPTRRQSATRQTGRALEAFVTRVGRASIGVAALLVLGVTWLVTVVFLTIEPRSVLRMLLRVSPPQERDAVERVFVRFSRMVRSWLWANSLVGLLTAVAVYWFLSALELPGALVWAVLAFFTQFIPKVGAFLAATPPLVVALAVDPGDAIWVILFYAALVEITSDVILPRLQGYTMRLHPVYVVAFVLAIGSSLGLFGAVLATPLAGLVAAVWHEAVVSRRTQVPDLDTRVERMLRAEDEAPQARAQSSAPT